jgi:putative ABC transport system permease protein
VFSTVIGWRSNDVFNIEAEGQLTQGAVAAVSGNFFDELGARPVAGRLLVPDDLREPSEDPAMVAVLGHGLWQRAFGSNVSAIGSRVAIEGVPFTIIGVAPPQFVGLGMLVEPDVTVPLTALPKVATFLSASPRTGTSNWVRVTGRLKPGVSLTQARAAIELLWPELKAMNVPPSLQGARRDLFLATGVSVKSAARGIETGPRVRARFTQPLSVLLAISLLVLLLACLNLASLMVARGVVAAHDIGVRVALGAERLRLMRPVFVEGVLLAGCGAGAGVLFAMWTSDALGRVILQDFTVRATLDVTPDWRVIAFTSALAVLGGLLCSAIAAWRAGYQDAAVALRQHSRTTTAGRHTGRWLVAGQVAVSLVLLVNAALLVRSLQQVRAVSSGMDPRGVVVAYPSPRPGGYRNVDNATYYRNVVARLESIPGVERAAVSNSKPAGGGIGGGELVAAATRPVDTDAVRATFTSISPQFFDTLGMSLTAGRDFTWDDHATSRGVAIVSATLAQRLFGTDAAIGQRVRVGVQARRQQLEIVGVVSDAHIYDLKDPNLAAIYVPSLQEPDLVDYKCFVIRGTGVSLEPIQAAVAPFGIETVSSSETLEYIIDRVLLQDRVTAVFAVFFGSVALLLAAIGLYGLISFEVMQRTREIAIRVALGADRRIVVKTVVASGLVITVGGLAIGSLVALGSVQLVKSLVFGITPHDPVSLIASVVLLAAVAFVASLLPAVRAARTDPTTSLRTV